MLAHHPLTGQPSHHSTWRAVLLIPETCEVLLHLHSCSPSQKELMFTLEVQGDLSLSYSAMMSHARVFVQEGGIISVHKVAEQVSNASRQSCYTGGYE